MNQSNKPTPGAWFHHEPSGYQHTRGGCISNSEDRSAPAICDVKGNDGQPFLANAALISEAGTVHHETGLTPRQLVEQRDALVAALSEMYEFFAPNAWGSSDNRRDALNNAEAALALFKGEPK